MLLQIKEPGASNENNEPEIALGIDLGTTNSLIALSNDKTVEIIPGDTCQTLLPSIATYGDLDIHSIKRLMGKSLEEAKALGYTQFPYDESVKEGMVHLKVGNESLSPVEISAEILKKLKIRAENHLKKPINRAVVTVPAHFDDAARAATRDAAMIAGLEVLRIINEPTAAALAYGLDEGAEGIYAIYDLGGGTFDISVLKLTKGVFQVLATGGNANLGGDDFDRALADYLNLKGSSHDTLLKAREIKESLTYETSEQISTEAFNDLIRTLVEETLEISSNTLEDANLTPQDLKGIVLVGGSTRTPLITQLIKERFGLTPLASLNPDETVVRGAALQAEALTRGSDTLLLDVVPLSLGLETMGGIVEKVIPRNSPIPIAKAQDFTTYEDGQSAMKIHVLQGEREMVSDLRSLAHFTLSGIPPLSAGQARIRVTFVVDADGLLTVSAEEKTTETKQTIEVKPSYGLSPEKVADLLRESLEKGQEDMEQRLLIQARVDAEQLIHAVNSALLEDSALLSDEELKSLTLKLEILKGLKNSEDRVALVQASEDLEKSSQSFAERILEKGIKHALEGEKVSEVGG